MDGWSAIKNSVGSCRYIIKLVLEPKDYVAGTQYFIFFGNQLYATVLGSYDFYIIREVSWFTTYCIWLDTYIYDEHCCGSTLWYKSQFLHKWRGTLKTNLQCWKQKWFSAQVKSASWSNHKMWWLGSQLVGLFTLPSNHLGCSDW